MTMDEIRRDHVKKAVGIEFIPFEVLHREREESKIWCSMRKPTAQSGINNLSLGYINQVED